MKLFRKSQPKLATPVEPAPIIGTAGSLREFVYLDEVSVYSLTSAPDMPPPVAMSETAESKAGEVLAGQIEGGAPLVAKANIRGELNSSRSTGLQVQRQFNIQSHFARLHGMYHPVFLLTAQDSPRTEGDADSLMAALAILEKKQRAVRATKLARGALVEIRVSLSAHHTFDVTAFMQLVTRLADKYPQLLQMNDLDGIRTAMEAGEFLAELIDDLIPVEGRAITHEIVVDEHGHQWVVDIDALTSVWRGQVATQPLRVVGVAETGSFWKDTRRILHAQAEFDVLGRVSRSGLQDHWTPVKMIETFKRVAPAAAVGLLAAVDELKNIGEDISPPSQVEATLTVAGAKFNRALAAEHNAELKNLPAETVALLSDDSSATLEGKFVALNHVADAFYANNTDLKRDRDRDAELRQRAWQEAVAVADQPVGNSSTDPSTPSPVLELEFVAMYW